MTRTAASSIRLFICYTLLLTLGLSAAPSLADSAHPQQQQQQPPPHASRDVPLEHGVLRVLPRDYEPSQPEPVVTPPISRGMGASSDRQTQQQAEQQTQQQRQPPATARSAPVVIEEKLAPPVHDTRPKTDLVYEPMPPIDELPPAHHHLDPLVAALKDEIKHLHHRLSELHLSKPQPQQQTQSPPGPVPSVDASAESVERPPVQHHLDPLVASLKDEIKRLHHRMHEQQKQSHTPRDRFEAEMYEALDKVLHNIKSEEYAKQLREHTTLLSNITEKLLDASLPINDEVHHAAVTLIDLAAASARTSQQRLSAEKTAAAASLAQLKSAAAGQQANTGDATGQMRSPMVGRQTVYRESVPDPRSERQRPRVASPSRHPHASRQQERQPSNRPRTHTQRAAGRTDEGAEFRESALHPVSTGMRRIAKSVGYAWDSLSTKLKEWQRPRVHAH